MKNEPAKQKNQQKGHQSTLWVNCITINPKWSGQVTQVHTDLNKVKPGVQSSEYSFSHLIPNGWFCTTMLR